MSVIINKTDETLFSEYLSGDEESFTELYRRHHGGVISLLTSIARSAEVADDLVQEVFMQLHEHRAFRRGATVKPWLHRIAFNCALQHKRKMGRNKMAVMNHASPLPVDDCIADGHPQAEDRVSQQEVRNRVRSLMMRLPQKYRQTLALYYLEGMPQNQMAKIVKVPPTTVKRWLSEAETAFAKLWNKAA